MIDLVYIFGGVFKGFLREEGWRIGCIRGLRFVYFEVSFSFFLGDVGIYFYLFIWIGDFVLCFWKFLRVFKRVIVIVIVR